jgi:hypothetical protein
VSHETFLQDLHAVRDRAGRFRRLADGQLPEALTLALEELDDLTEQAFERARRDLGEGPCVDAFARGTVVWAPDLRTDPRWPRLARPGPATTSGGCSRPRSGCPARTSAPSPP